MRGSIDRVLNCKWCGKFPKGFYRQAPATLPEMGSLEAGVFFLVKGIGNAFLNRLEMTHLIEKYMVQSLHISLYMCIY